MAGWPFRPPVERTDRGFRINLGRDEKDMIERLLREFRVLLLGPSDDPALMRLFPAAYHLPDDAELDAEYQRFMREEIVASRLTGIDVVIDALNDKSALTEGQIMALVQAVNGLRLVLAVALDLSDEHDPDEIDDDHPQAADHELYSFLSWLLEWSVRALTGE